MVTKNRFYSILLEGGYYFLNKTRFKLGGSIGIGLSYVSNTTSITTFYKSDGSQEEEQEAIGSPIRKENIVASIGLPFQWQINPKFGVLLSPHFQLLLLNSLKPYKKCNCTTTLWSNLSLNLHSKIL